MPKLSLIYLNHSLINPYLIYCLPVWSATYCEHLKPLIVLQKKCISFINGSEFIAHTNSHFHNDKVFKFIDFYCVELEVYVLSNLNKFTDVCVLTPMRLVITQICFLLITD